MPPHPLAALAASPQRGEAKWASFTSPQWGEVGRASGRVRGHFHRLSSLRMVSRTPAKFVHTSSFETRITWKPRDSRIRVRSLSRFTSASVECVAPSTSTISLPSRVTKSTTKRSILCWRRNFQRESWRLRRCRQSTLSALVWAARSDRARRLNSSVPTCVAPWPGSDPSWRAHAPLGSIVSDLSPPGRGEVFDVPSYRDLPPVGRGRAAIAARVMGRKAHVWITE